MTIKHFMSEHPGWIQTSHMDVYGGQEIRVGPGHEMLEFIKWWHEWSQIMKNPHPSVRDALQQVKVVHELSKEQKV